MVHSVVAEAICCLIAKLSNGLVTKLNTAIKCSNNYLWTASKNLQTRRISIYISLKLLGQNLLYSVILDRAEPVAPLMG